MTLYEALPGSSLNSVTPLPRGKSFNNRIYYLNVKLHRTHNFQDLWPSENAELVLKVNGRFFGPAKIQNEVACLCILAESSLDIPTPRVVAWSSDGRSIRHINAPQERAVEETVKNVGEVDFATKHGWILMTRMKGDPLSVDKLSQEDIRRLASQLADIVSNWRQMCPASDFCGNIGIVDEGYCGTTTVEVTRSTRSGLFMAIGTSLLGSDLTPSSPVSNLYDYFRLKLEGRLDKLNTLVPLTANRHLISESEISLIKPFLTSKYSASMGKGNKASLFSRTTIYLLAMCL